MVSWDLHGILGEKLDNTMDNNHFFHGKHTIPMVSFNSYGDMSRG